jgi:hypothetical protein
LLKSDPASRAAGNFLALAARRGRPDKFGLNAGMHHTIGFVKSVERMRGSSLALAPSAMASMNNQWWSDQTISNLPASACAFHVQLNRSGNRSFCGQLGAYSVHTSWNE